MKNGYKHKTGAFGTAAENYVSRLFMLLKNPDGNRRPDLCSVGNTYNPVFSLEVKSGTKRKGVMVDYQLHYAIKTVEAYRELFGEDPPKREIITELFDTPILDKGRIEERGYVAYYYCVIDRIDGLKSEELDRPYSTVKCEWGDIFMVPADFAFHAFVAARIKRTGENDQTVIAELRKMMKEDALSWNSAGYVARKLKKNSWQNIHGRDILSIFEDDPAIATVDGRDRIGIIANNYDLFGELKRIKIPGPNNTSIYTLSAPQDYQLFDGQVRNKINSRLECMERITSTRERAIPLLSKIHPANELSFLYAEDNGPSAQKTVRRFLKTSEIDRLERLVNWLGVGERALTIPNPF